MEAIAKALAGRANHKRYAGARLDRWESDYCSGDGLKRAAKRDANRAIRRSERKVIAAEVEVAS